MHCLTNLQLIELALVALVTLITFSAMWYNHGKFKGELEGIDKAYTSYKNLNASMQKHQQAHQE